MSEFIGGTVELYDADVKQPMRILSIGNLLPPAHVGGYEVICAGVMQHLNARGHRVMVLVSDRRLETDSEPHQFEVRRKLRLYRTDGRYPAMTLVERYQLERHNHRMLERALRHHRPDLVTWWNMSGLSLGLIEQVAKAGVASVAMVCDWWPRGVCHLDRWVDTWQRHPRAGRLVEMAGRLPTRPSMTSVTRWVFISEFVRHELTADVLHGIDGQVVRAGYEEELFRQRAPAEWDNRLLFVGRVAREKGVDTALRALAALPRNYRLSIVGSGTPDVVREAKALSRSLGLQDRVRWLGAVGRSELSQQLAEADALAFPVRWAEPWGLVPLEAMATGLPVVATVKGGSGEYIVPEENALAFPEDDHESLAQAVQRLACNSNLQSKLRNGGLKTASRFTARAFNEKFEELCAETATPNGRVARTAGQANQSR